MSLRRIIFSVMAVCLGVVGVACGLLCLVCLIIFLFWQGLGVGTVVLALLCLFCVGLAVILSGRGTTRREAKRPVGSGSRSLKAWWRSCRKDSASALYPAHQRGASYLKLGAAGTPPPVPEEAKWPEDLTERSPWPEPLDIGGPHNNRDR